MTLLYAEDDQETRENYAFILKPYFKEIFLAQDGAEALIQYHEKRPDIMLLDISMPHVSGLDMLKKIRQKDQQTPVVMLTAHSQQELLLQAVNLKLDAYFIKPVDENLLKNKLIMLINQLQAKKVLFIGENLLLDLETYDLLYKDFSIKLTKKERILMQVLTASPGNYISKDALILCIWADEIPDASYDNKLIQLIFRFNKKIARCTDNNKQLVENSYALGYRLRP